MNATIQTALAGLAGAAANLVAQNGMPTSAQGWISLVVSAAIAAGLLHVTAPRNQGATIVAAPK